MKAASHPVASPLYQSEAYYSSLAYQLPLLTLLPINQGVLPSTSPLARLPWGLRVEVGCPEAFLAEAEGSLCPRVPSKAFAKILSAALWSRSKTILHPGQMCVRTERLFLTTV